MYISSKDWKNYIERLSALDKKAGDLMREWIAKHGFTDTKAMTDYAFALAQKYGEGSAALSAEMYDAVAEMQGKLYPPAEAMPPPDYGEVAKTVNGILKHSQNPNSVANGVSRLVKRTGADTTLNNALRDGAEFAWVPNGDTCAFCITLASRGWQRMSKKALKNGHAEHIHANCDCTYSIRFDGKSGVQGYDPEKYREMYYGAEGDTPKDRINSLRRMHYEQNKDVINAQKRARYSLEQLRKSDGSISNDDIIELIKDGPASSALDSLQGKNVLHKPVSRLESQLSEEEIIKRLHGRDTGGRCTSLALAYAGNKNGLDVVDFRKDASVDIFSKPSIIRQLTELAKGHTVKEYDEYTAVNKLLKKVVPGKEYILSAGKHTAVIRKAERGYEFLQLQRDMGYGYRRLTASELKNTFKCAHSRSSYGIKLESTSMLFDIGELKDSKEFQYLLGFINNQ